MALNSYAFQGMNSHMLQAHTLFQKSRIHMRECEASIKCFLRTDEVMTSSMQYYRYQNRLISLYM